MMIWPQILVESALAKEPVDDTSQQPNELGDERSAFQAFYEETARPCGPSFAEGAANRNWQTTSCRKPTFAFCAPPT